MEVAKKLIRSLNFDPKLYAKYKDPRSSGSLSIMLTRFFPILIMAMSKKGHKSVNILRN